MRNPFMWLRMRRKRKKLVCPAPLLTSSLSSPNILRRAQDDHVQNCQWLLNECRLVGEYRQAGGTYFCAEHDAVVHDSDDANTVRSSPCLNSALMAMHADESFYCAERSPRSETDLLHGGVEAFSLRHRERKTGNDQNVEVITHACNTSAADSYATSNTASFYSHPGPSQPSLRPHTASRSTVSLLSNNTTLRGQENEVFIHPKATTSLGPPCLVFDPSLPIGFASNDQHDIRISRKQVLPSLSSRSLFPFPYNHAASESADNLQHGSFTALKGLKEKQEREREENKEVLQYLLENAHKAAPTHTDEWKTTHSVSKGSWTK